MSRELLERLCEMPWSDIRVANPEGWVDGAVRANHVLIECEVPVVIAASSTSGARGEEHFTLCFVDDPAQIRAFNEGPFPPHNLPVLIPLGDIIPANVSAFLGARKRTWGATRVAAIVEGRQPTSDPGVQEIAVECSGWQLIIRADQAVPMSITVEVRNFEEARGGQ